MTGITWHPLAKDQRLAALMLPEPGTPLSVREAQGLAELVALKGVGNVAPNPLVGAVLVDRDHAFVTAGAHERVGAHHAEINALLAAETNGLTDRIKGGTLYVTLEPCAHQGRTPACAPRVAQSGLAQVVFGVQDPNPVVNGRGAAILSEAGVTWRLDEAWSASCKDLAEVFLHQIATGTPFVGLKVATSLDGVMARRGDRRVFLTGPRARAYGHFLRVRYDAIAVGSRTLLLDDPSLDPRDSLVKGRTPRRVVVDPKGTALKESDLSRLAILKREPETVVWAVGTGAVDTTELKRRGATVLDMPVDARGRYAPLDLLTGLGKLGVTSLLLEGGAGLHDAFLSAGLVQKLHHFQAPLVLGDSEGPVRFAGMGASFRADGPVHLTSLDPDWLIETRLRTL